jgi:hypothetical protein
MKDLRSQIFRLGAILHASKYVGVHALEVELVKLAKAGGVLLRSLHQKPLVRFFLQSLHFPTFKEFSAVFALHIGKRTKAQKGYAYSPTSGKAGPLSQFRKRVAKARCAVRSYREIQQSGKRRFEIT